jgi:hypothetical protein
VEIVTVFVQAAQIATMIVMIMTKPMIEPIIIPAIVPTDLKYIPKMFFYFSILTY